MSYRPVTRRLNYDPVTKTVKVETGFPEVFVNSGQELHTRFYNNTGVTITNGTVVNTTGFNVANEVFEGSVADNTSPATSLSVIGIATHDVLDGEIGVATSFGDVNNMPTNGLSSTGPTDAKGFSRKKFCAVIGSI